jgi:hypothetical protein
MLARLTLSRLGSVECATGQAKKAVGSADLHPAESTQGRKIYLIAQYQMLVAVSIILVTKSQQSANPITVHTLGLRLKQHGYGEEPQGSSGYTYGQSQP